MRGASPKVTGEVVNWGRLFDNEWELNATALKRYHDGLWNMCINLANSKTEEVLSLSIFDLTYRNSSSRSPGLLLKQMTQTPAYVQDLACVRTF